MSSPVGISPQAHVGAGHFGMVGIEMRCFAVSWIGTSMERPDKEGEVEKARLRLAFRRELRGRNDAPVKYRDLMGAGWVLRAS